MSKIYLVFDSKSDCDIFVSIKADHWWWLHGTFDGMRINDTEIQVNESFRTVFVNPLNKEPLHKGLTGMIRLKE